MRRRATDAGSSWLVLAGAMLLAFAVRVDQAGRLPTPQLLCDEFIYAELAKSFADEGRLLFRGEPLHLSLLYPILLAPAWLAERMETTYAIAKAINVALMTASAVPLYLLGRRLLTPGWSLLAPVLTLLLPMAHVTGLLMTESAFMPAFLLAAYAIVLALERPTMARQAFALAAIALAAAVRAQGAVLIAVLVTAVVLVIAFELRAASVSSRRDLALARLQPFWPTAAALGAAAVALLAVRGVQFGAYEEVLRPEYSLRGAWRMMRLLLADLALTSGLVPLSALIVLAWRAFAGVARPPAERAFVAVAAAAAVWLVVQAGFFTSRFSPGLIGERYVFYAVPLLFLALAVWLAQGLPRPRVATAVAAVLPGVLVVLEPVLGAVAPLNLGLFALHGLALRLGKEVSDLVWPLRLAIVLAALAFALLRRPAARLAIPLALCAFLAVSSHSARGAFRDGAVATSRDPAINPTRQWISEAIGEANVGYLFTGDSDVFASSRTMLSVNFWNPSVGTVLHLGPRELCRLPSRAARLDTRTGRIVADDGRGLPRNLVAPAALALAGAELARQGPLVLYRAAEPASLLHSTNGVYSDGWMGADAEYTRYYGRGAGHAVVELSREFFTAETVPSRVRVVVRSLGASGRRAQRIGRRRETHRSILRAGEKRTVVLPAQPPFRVQVHIEPTFSAAGFGTGDSRELGARVQFAFRRRGA